MTEAADAADGLVGWSYVLNNSAVQSLGAGDSVTENYVVTVADGHGGTAQQTVAVSIVGTNDAPTTTPVALAPIAEDSGGRLITQGELLGNANDVDGDALAATGLTISAGGGSLTNNLNGTWTYVAAANDDTQVSFSYTVSDGADGGGLGQPRHHSGQRRAGQRQAGRPDGQRGHAALDRRALGQRRRCGRRQHHHQLW